MKFLSTLLKATLCFIITIILVLGFGCSQVRKTPHAAEYPYLPIITEILPFPSVEESPWIEFYNPLDKKINAAGLEIVINDTHRYSIPEKLPPVPPKGFIIFQLDGKGEEANLYEYREKITVLHSPPDFIKAKELKIGQIAVFRTVDKEVPKLVGFVSWGAPGSRKSLTTERNRIWTSKWFVNMARSFGDYDPRDTVRAGYSIGLYPGSKAMNMRDWIVYSEDETTPGKVNVVPRPAMFTLSDGAAVLSEDIAVGWTGNRRGEKYQFQIAKDSDFTSIVEDKTLEVPLYKPEKVLPEGVYYYRVKAIYKDGGESAWSGTMKLVSKRMSFAYGNDTDGQVQEHVLTAMVHKFQRKDTHLLCLDGCASDLDATTAKHWDDAHPNATPVPPDHGDMNCVRASISMMVSFYGGSISQDRIAYFTEEGRTGVGNGIPEGDLAHSVGMSYSSVNGGEETVALEWALDATIDFMDNSPTFAQVRGWLDANRPIMTRTPGHLRTMNGYRVDNNNVEWVHILDPWTGPRWETFATWDGGDRGTWVGPVSAPTVLSDEPGVWNDSDADGVMDFDEQIRFLTGRFDIDSDNDDVQDKNDIREYVFDAGDNYSKRTSDFDADGVRKEKDPDNDGDTFNDGCEDQNFNGKYEPALGESNNFAVDAGLVCDSKPIHAIIVFDRSGSMVYPPSDPVKKYDEAASAAVLFLDTWLGNNPPANTEVGLVFYDHNAYFDTGANINTTLEIFNQSKRDMINDAFSPNRPLFGSTSIGGGILKAMDAQGFDVDSVPADDQHRVIIVLTDGKENTNPRMDDPAVVQKMADGKVDGYVLGIGDETQINMDKLNSLADILNHYPASFANDLDNFELEKFFLQVLAETQGLEFITDPVDEIAMGETKYRQVAVSEGTERVTFVIVWNTPNAKLDFKLKDPLDNPVTPDVIKSNIFYQVSMKDSPDPGDWTLEISAEHTGEGLPPEKVRYNLMALEKNDQIRSYFQARGGFFLTGQPILLTAELSKKRMPAVKADVLVEVVQPKIGFGKFVADARVRPVRSVKLFEKDIKMTPLDMKYHLMTEKKLRVPRTKTVVKLNDAGENGDEIPGDGKYSAYFKDTKADGIYTFRFLMKDVSSLKKLKITREKTLSVLVSPKIHPKSSKVNILQREFREKANTTYLKFYVIPKDRYGGYLGPGHPDLIRFDVKEGKVIYVLDKLDGSYEIEMTIEGNYKKGISLLPYYRKFDLKKQSLK